ncbi:HAD-IA family hydrolase [Aquihabitans daechungensis]|uniref:HAD-IA family hydrolase n=1 Tax=Aquihabitans daechungensis TaxID=1052257 RepID=UPI003BA06CC2
MSIAAVLFDFGGVITTSPFEAFARYEEQHALPSDFLRSVNATDPDTNAWARLERNEIELADFDAAFAQESERLGHRVAGADVLGLLSGDLRPEFVRAVEIIGRRTKTALLTNNVVGMDPSGEIAQVLAHFDVVIESSVVGIRKPDPAFYELACERLGIEADEAVFLDDLGINLKPARALGMRTIKVTDPATALAELESILGYPLT